MENSSNINDVILHNIKEFDLGSHLVIKGDLLDPFFKYSFVQFFYFFLKNLNQGSGFNGLTSSHASDQSQLFSSWQLSSHYLS
ncbi:MAG: hypothetical protein IPN73_00175 [Saprospiraceae bacterium]|nr:hypothetical protein [Saprospiraceae bacterium]